ncbi:hypothetical protein K456DRAFT_30552 [Colletotrichum gloeosporioides 23]|nr:hypothetical protein K456DRAFT_30552 [Colletotrichum gloeosporioides 23]
MALKSVLLLVLLLSLAPGQLPPQQVTHSRHSSPVTRHSLLLVLSLSLSEFPGRAREASLRPATSLGVLGSGVPGPSQSRSPVKRDDIDDPFCPPLPFQPVPQSPPTVAYNSCEAAAVSVVFDGGGFLASGACTATCDRRFPFYLVAPPRAPLTRGPAS